MAIHYVCSHCRSNENAPDQSAGMNVPCKACGQMNAVPYPQGMSGKKVGTGMGIGAILAIVFAVLLVLMLGCGGVVVALMLPAVQSAREAARRMSSQNNMKQLMLAMHNYHDANNAFPPAYIADKDGKPMTSWRVLILPYIEQSHLSQQYDASKPWDSPENLAVAENIPPTYRSPLVETTPQNRLQSNYLLMTGKGTAYSDPTQGAKMSAITDGTSNTICMVEVADTGAIWTQPTDLDAAQLDMIIHAAKDARPGQLNATTNRGLNVGFYDGSVRLIDSHVPPEELKKAIESQDGMPVNLP